MSKGVGAGQGMGGMWEAAGPHSQSSPPPSSGLRPSFAVLLLLSAAWLLALLSVNSDTLLFHYLFAACNCIQVPGRPMPGEPHGDGRGSVAVGAPMGADTAAASCLPGPPHLPLLRGA